MRLIALVGRRVIPHATPAIDKLELPNYNNLFTQSYHSLPRSDCGSCQIANMASVTNADDNDKNSVLFVSNDMYMP